MPLSVLVQMSYFWYIDKNTTLSVLDTMSSSEEDPEIQSGAESSDDDEQLTGVDAWQSLGIKQELAQMCVDLKWSKPTKIQKLSIPVALDGKDVIGLAETGSGKTAAFALPGMRGSTTSSNRDRHIRLLK